METWDLYTANGDLTGETIVRGDRLPPDRYHLVVHLWIRNSRGNYLIQKRSQLVESKKGMWAFTGGSATTGDDSFMAMKREVEEELGLVLTTDHKPLMVRRSVGRNSIVDQWLLILDLEPESLPLGPEVEKVRFASGKEIRQMMKRGEFWPLSEEYLNAVLK